MKTSSKIILGVVALIVIGALIFLVWKMNKKSNEQSNGNTTSNGGTNSGTGTNTNTNSGKGGTVQNSDFPLKRSSAWSGRVAILQEKLNRKLAFMTGPYYPLDKNNKPIKELVVDGLFGDRTERVVKFVFGTYDVSEEQYNSLS